MNGYWKKDAVSIAEAMEMAQGLWARCHSDIREHDRYWEKGGNAKMGLKNAPSVYVYVWFSPWMHRSGVTVERQGLKERMTFSPLMDLLDMDMGYFSPYLAWKYDPSCDGRMDDLRRACVDALERYRSSMGAPKEERQWKLEEL